MTLDKIFSYGGIGAVALLALIEIAPIKIDPWSWLVKKIGNALNGELMKKVDSMGNDLNEKVDNLSADVNSKIGKLHDDVLSLDAKNDAMEAVTWRYRIIRFGDECLHGVRHSKEHFVQILSDITNYKHYCDTHPDFENEQAVQTIEIIEEVYKKCVKENDFLK